MKQASGSWASSGSASGCSSAGSPISTVLPSDELDEFNFCKGKKKKHHKCTVNIFKANISCVQNK